MLSLPVHIITSIFRHKALTGAGLSPKKSKENFYQEKFLCSKDYVPDNISEQCSIRSCIWISTAALPIKISMMSQLTSNVVLVNPAFIKAHNVYHKNFQ